MVHIHSNLHQLLINSLSVFVSTDERKNNTWLAKQVIKLIKYNSSRLHLKSQKKSVKEDIVKLTRVIICV